MTISAAGRRRRPRQRSRQPLLQKSPGGPDQLYSQARNRPCATDRSEAQVRALDQLHAEAARLGAELVEKDDQRRIRGDWPLELCRLALLDRQRKHVMATLIQDLADQAAILSDEPQRVMLRLERTCRDGRPTAPFPNCGRPPRLTRITGTDSTRHSTRRWMPCGRMYGLLVLELVPEVRHDPLRILV